jgi:hypothetical protein
MSNSSEHNYNLGGHVRHQGLSVAGVTVLLFDLLDGASDPKPLKEQKTGVKGDFLFSVRSGVYRIEVVPDSTTRILKHSLSEVKVKDNVNLNIGLTTGSIVSGRIQVDGAGALTLSQSNLTEEMLTGVEVVALGIEPSSYKAICPVAADGTFTLVLPRGKYHIALRCLQDNVEEDKSKIHSDSFKLITTHSDVVSIVSDIDMTLDWPNLFKFKGEVVDSSGAPVSGAYVHVSPAQSRHNLLLTELSFGARTRCDQSGHFQLSLEPGTYDMAIEPPDSTVLFGTAVSDINVSENCTRRFELAEGHRLEGQVVFDNQNLSQSLVRLQNLETRQEYIARTAEGGHFKLAVPAGEYKLVVLAHPKDAPAKVIDGVDYNSLAPWTRNITVGEDTSLKVDLKEGTALQGKVCDDSGQARPGIRISVYAHQVDGNLPDARSNALVYGITDGEGQYCLFLSPGLYWLVVHKDFANARLLEIESEPHNEDIVWHGWSQIQFDVVGEDNHVVPRCQVQYQPYGLEGELHEVPKAEKGALDLPHGYMLTGDQGSCKLTLPAGIYTFKFVPPQAGSYQGRLIRQLSISSDVTRRVVLELKSSAILSK